MRARFERTMLAACVVVVAGVAGNVCAACGSSDAAPAAEPEARPPPSAATTNVAPPPSSPDEMPSPSPAPTDGPPPCPKAPCAARPIVFVHGHNGSSDDFKAMLDGLVLPSTTTRFDEYRFVGTTDHAGWAPRSIARRSWLFAFDYYVAKGTDKRGSFTAGPGRVGSNKAKPCTSPKGSGALVADDASYDDVSTHDYAEDLASMITDVLRATGAKQVDLVAHSLGGFVVRSFLAFYDGGGKDVGTVLLLSSPHQGIPYAPVESLIGQAQPWMAAHELTELAGGGPFAKSSFLRCGDPAGSYADWPRGLLDQETAHTIVPALHVMSGSNDLLVSYDNADHPQAKSHVVVDGADHPGILKAPVTIQRVDTLCGGIDGT